MRIASSQSGKYGATGWTLRILAVLALIYYAWMMFDLITHPFSPGSNPVLKPYLFKWLSGINGTFTIVTALFILRRLPGNTIGFILLIFGVGVAGWSGRTNYGSLEMTAILTTIFTIYFFLLALPALTALLLHFPTGSIFPQRFMNWGWGLIIAQSLTGILSNLGIPAYQNGLIHNPIYLPALFPFSFGLNAFAVTIPPLAGVISLGLRYRAGGQRERTQIKWLAWLGAMAILIATAAAILFPIGTNGEDQTTVNQLVNIAIFMYWQAFPAVAIGIALLRYRLWDIDLIIRRTLQYGAITAVLSLVYLGAVALLQQVFTAIAGQASPLAVVLSTLLSALLFSPLRRGLQSIIDRRFYRQKYDAEQATADFSSAVRREVQLDQLTGRLVAVVAETVQPEQVTVWIRPPGASRSNPIHPSSQNAGGSDGRS